MHGYWKRERIPKLRKFIQQGQTQMSVLGSQKSDIIMPALDQGIKHTPKIAEEEAALYWMFQVVAAN
jgi:hypothetical protein